MAEAFDAYYVWLGIGPEEQPANHYRLLGIRLFEPNPEVIESAADRQMAHLRTFQQGKNAALSQRLLNEVSAARVCLLNPATKAAYDAQLRAAAAAATRPLPRTSPNLPMASPLGSPSGTVQAQPATNWDALIGGDAGPSTSRSPKRRMSSPAPRKSNNQLVYLISAAVVLLAAGVGLVVYINGMEGEPPPHDAQAAKPVVPQTGQPEKAVTVANTSGPAPPVEPPRVVNVTIDWPVADREDARLTIDGKEQAIDAIKLEFPLTQGRHVIQLTRDGFQPIRQTLDIGSQPLPPLAPRWVPKAAVASADEPTPVTPTPANGGDDAAATPPMKKLPVPSAAEQAQIAKQLDETYPSEHVAEKDHALAEKLLELADSPGNSSAERYMLFTKAVGLAAGTSDFNLAFRGVDSLDAAYEIDGFEMKQKLLDDAAKTITTSDQVAAVVAAAEQVIDQSLADERYDTALELAATAKKVAENPRAEARLRKEATERIARRVREIEALQKAAAVATEAEATLEKSPDDPAANLTLGRWYCLYKHDWDRGLPLFAKGPDGPFKKLAQLELAVDLTLKPQLDLADGWWDVGQKESGGIARENARAHAGEIYRLQLPNLQGGLKKTSVEQRLKEVDANSISASSRRQIDLLKLVDIKRDVVKGNWTAVNGGISSGDVLALPYAPPEEYDFEVEFARISGNDVIGQICVGGGRQFQWAMSGWGGNVSGFDRVNDKGPDVNPTRRAFGVADTRRHTSIVKVRKDSVEAWVDGRLIDQWKTDYQDMSLYDGLTIPDRKGLGLVSYSSPTMFFSAKVTEITGIGKVMARPISERRTTQVPSANSGAAASSVFPRNRWVDVLSLVDTTKHSVKGTWSRNGTDISCEPEDEARIEVPVIVDGSYDLDVDFTRTDGDADVNTIFSVGGHQCAALLSMSHGRESGLECVDDKRPSDSENPTAVRPGTLTNGRRYKLLVKVRQSQADRARVDVFLDGRPYFAHWEGNPASLTLGRYWHLPNSRELGLGTWKTLVTFHSMRLKLLAGRATNLESNDGGELKPAPESPPAASSQFPRNHSIDVLKLVDTQADAVRGLWSRDGHEISCQPGDFSRVKLPVIPSGGYDLEVEFTRTGGRSDICFALPVGPSECTVLLSASNGDYSGLEYVDGVDVHNPKNPVVVRPGALENGRRYRLLASVRHFEDGTFSIDVMLDGKLYLPHWQGKPSSLKVYSGWKLPNAGQPGVGALKSAVTYHSARLRVVSGEAIPETEIQKPSTGLKIIKARWGGGNNWADVSVPVQRAVGEGKTVVAKRDFLGADPTPGWRKHLEITYEKDGQQKSVSIDEDRQWTPQEYAGEGQK